MKIVTDKSKIKSYDNELVNKWVGDGVTTTFFYSTQFDLTCIVVIDGNVQQVTWDEAARSITFPFVPVYGTEIYLLPIEVKD